MATTATAFKAKKGDTVKWSGKVDPAQPRNRHLTGEVIRGGVTHFTLQDAKGNKHKLPQGVGVLKMIGEKKAAATSVKKPAQAKTSGPTAITKMDQCRAIYTRLLKACGKGKTPVRKDVLVAFNKEAGISLTGASTYHFNIKRELADAS